jgi:hypothetical protein
MWGTQIIDLINCNSTSSPTVQMTGRTLPTLTLILCICWLLRCVSCLPISPLPAPAWWVRVRGGPPKSSLGTRSLTVHLLLCVCICVRVCVRMCIHVCVCVLLWASGWVSNRKNDCMCVCVYVHCACMNGWLPEWRSTWTPEWRSRAWHSSPKTHRMVSQDAYSHEMPRVVLINGTLSMCVCQSLCQRNLALHRRNGYRCVNPDPAGIIPYADVTKLPASPCPCLFLTTCCAWIGYRWNALYQAMPNYARKYKFTRYRTDFISPRKNIVFCPAGWLRARKISIYFGGAGLKNGDFWRILEPVGKNPCAGLV